MSSLGKKLREYKEALGQFESDYFLDDFRTCFNASSGNIISEIKNLGCKSLSLKDAVARAKVLMKQKEEENRAATVCFESEMKKLKKRVKKQTRIHKMQVPMHGPLRAVCVNLEDQMAQVNYNPEFNTKKGIKTGISGKVLSHPLLKKQQEQVIAENLMRF